MKNNLKILLHYLIGCFLSHPQVFAGGIITDGTLGPTATLSSTSPGTFIVPQSLGRTSTDGSSLFHSFQEFNVHFNQSVFLEGNSPQRIIMRVTGANPSEINGGLGLTGISNNAQAIFLINPNGVMIGANAAINIPGVFHYSNMPIIQFADGSFFSAFDKAGSTLSSAPVSAFGFVERTGVINAPMIVPYDGSRDMTGNTSAGIFYINRLPQQAVPINPLPVNPTPVNPIPITPLPINPTPTNPLPINPTPVNPLPINPTPTNPLPINPTPTNPLPINPTPVNPTPINPIYPTPTPISSPIVPNTTTEKITQAEQITKDSAQKPLLSGFITDTKINQVIAKQDSPIKQGNLIQPNTFFNPSAIFTSGSLIKPSTVSKQEAPIRQLALTQPLIQQNTEVKQQSSTTTSPQTGQTNLPSPSADAPLQPGQENSVQPSTAPPPAENVPVIDINTQNKRLGLQNFEPYPCSRENSLMRVGKGGIPANEMTLGFIPPASALSLKLQTTFIPSSTLSTPFTLSQSGASFPCTAL